MSNRRFNLSWLPGWKNSPSARWAWSWLLLAGFLALFGPLIANEKPYYCKLDGVSYFPLWSGISEAELSRRHPAHSPVIWKTTNFESVWHAIIPYSHFTVDLQAGSLVSPVEAQKRMGRFRHWLGTDPIGRDVMAGMIRGCRVSLLIGFGSMIIALLIGVPLGAVAAWCGNQEWRISVRQLIVGFAVLVVAIWIWFAPLPIWVKWLATMLLVASYMAYFRKKESKVPTPVSIPVDNIVMAGISIIDGFPGIFLILILVALIPAKGWLVVMSVIAFLRWPVMARYMRAEVFKIMETPYIQAVRILNLSSRHILLKHITPYAIRPVLVSFVFGVSSAILAESSLSYLGIGLPAEEINWGRLLAQSRNHFDAWWLVLFPGAAIFFTLMSLYTLGNSLSETRTVDSH